MMFVIVTLTLLLTSSALLDCGTDTCDEFSGHRNLGFVQVQGSIPQVSLTPVARTFLTDDLEATTAWFKGMFGVIDVPSNISYDPYCARAHTMMWVEGFEVTFVQYLDSHASNYIQAAEDQWKAVQQGQYDYTRWMDNHDGFQLEPEIINVDYFMENDFPVQKGGVFSRVLIPRTSWAMELSGDVIIAASQQIAENDPGRTFKVANADFVCRVPLGDKVDDTQFSPRFWWKSTFASADPEAAASFAETYLFGTWITSEYPLGDNCTLSTWVVLPQNTYQLHFAHTAPCETPSPNIDEWVQHQESIRSLETGKFDQHMSNTVVYWTNSLDPFVQKLKMDNVPFVVLELIEGTFGLYISIPKNGIVLQIRSNHLTETSPLGFFDACAGGSTIPVFG